ncbi:dimethylmenaquinone methyltransferase [Enemella evansiae]|uniref:RraA family protein n=1 Tax=Enemella evansiae TaxID=2016499 RepID=UPI000B9604CF|nr:RraA family protein [Enemella evansiae]OYN97357.1 dimethylmenaquinone methyltransferase [Enemella evansiae]
MTEPRDVRPELIAEARRTLYSPVIGDVLDQLGRLHQFLPPDIRGLTAEHRLLGRAMPVIVGDVFGANDRPFGKLTQALDQLEPGEVYVAATGVSSAAAWGEILTAAARTRGAVGAVIDGYHRDTPAVLEQNWPVFSRGSYALDSRPRSAVVDYRVPIEVGGVAVRPGDLIFGDVDGVVVIPQEIESEVLERALQKASAENTVRSEIEAGDSATEVLARHGIL